MKTIYVTNINTNDVLRNLIDIHANNSEVAASQAEVRRATAERDRKYSDHFMNALEAVERTFEGNRS